MSTASSLSFRNVLGLNSSCYPNIIFVGEEYVVFPAGNSVVVHNINSRQQRIFNPPEEFASGISAFAFSEGKPNLAFADNSIEPAICIFEIHSMHPRNFLHLGRDFESTGLVSLSFSGDGRYLLGHGTSPGWSLVVWDWESNQLLATVKTSDDDSPVKQVSFSPGKQPKIAVTGNNVLKIYQLEQGKLNEVMIANPKIGDIPCHLWLNDNTLLCSNSSGDILFVSTDQSYSVLPDTERTAHPFMAMARYKKGFIAGNEGGVLYVFEPSGNKFSLARTVKLFGDELPIPVYSISVDPSEELAVISLENNRVVTVALSNGDIYMNTEEKPLIQPFHKGAIWSCSACCRKPLLATCGEDKTVRVWNYIENSLEIVKEFTEPVYSVSFHPDGLSMLIGFGDKLRFCSVFYDDIRSIREFPYRECRCVKFSNGGHLFAVVNGSKIFIYSTLTFQLVNTLYRHALIVRDVVWCESDTVLASVGDDGAIYVHRTDTTNRDENCTTPQVRYTSIAAMPDVSSIYVSGNDKKLKEIQNGQVIREMFFPFEHTKVLLSNNGQMLFSGTSDGKVFSYSLPIGGDKLQLNCHTNEITSLAISFDDSLLFTTGKDGVICIFNIRDKDNRIRNPERMSYSEEVLTTRNELEEKHNQLKTLENDRLDLELSFKVKREMLESKFNTDVEQKREAAKKDKDECAIRSNNLKKEKEEAEMNNRAKIDQLTKKWENKLAQQDDEFGTQILEAHTKCENLSKEKERLDQEWRDRLQTENARHQQIIEQIQDDQRSRLQFAQAKLEETMARKQKKILQIEEIKKEIAEEKDTAIVSTEKKLREILQQDENLRTTLQDEHGNKTKECATLQKQYEQQQVERNKLMEEQEKLQKQLAELTKEINRLKEETQQKEASIRDREIKIGNAKKENQELEKYHQVLTHQENMLKKQTGPLETQIKHYDTEISSMDGQLEAAHKRTTEQNEAIAQLQAKLQQVIEQERTQTRKLMGARSYFEQAKHDLHEVVQHFHSKDDLRDRFMRFYNEYIKNEKIEDIQLDEFVDEEHKRQKAALEKQLKELRAQHIRDDKFQSKEQVKLLMQNASLIEELQQLRQENKILNSHAAMSKRPHSARTLLPATEAQRLIEENKRQIAKLEQQLAAYNT